MTIELANVTLCKLIFIRLFIKLIAIKTTIQLLTKKGYISNHQLLNKYYITRISKTLSLP